MINIDDSENSVIQKEIKRPINRTQSIRYEESKKGRYREFFQYGVELIGASGPLAEAEVISLAIDMLDACGLENWEVRIGHVGILHDILSGLGLSSEGEPESPIASAMRLLD